jgi:hypothetical protein
MYVPAFTLILVLPPHAGQWMKLLVSIMLFVPFYASGGSRTTAALSVILLLYFGYSEESAVISIRL